jgi:BirA family transcriptional regulator, biotin operon repressor / biotin---[acetyl-CoA-carboxylase] ligase
MDESSLKRLLIPNPVSEIRIFETIGSTNDYALEWADSGALDFSVVIADHQTKGRGRLNRKWVTNPGSSLAFSVILKPTEVENERLALFAPLAGLAIRETFESHLNLRAQIKWPNDVLINRKKCTGILVEAAWTGSDMSGVIIGIGINISNDSIPTPSNQLFNATSLENETHSKIDRFSVLAAVLRTIKAWRREFGTEYFFNEWKKHLAFMGEKVRIEQSEKPSIIGVVQGIDDNGRLVLSLEDNEVMCFEVGDVHLRPTDKDLIGGNNA